MFVNQYLPKFNQFLQLNLYKFVNTKINFLRAFFFSCRVHCRKDTKICMHKMFQVNPIITGPNCKILIFKYIEI